MNFLNDISIVTIGAHREENSNDYTHHHDTSEIVNIETKYAGKVKRLIKALGGYNYKYLPDISELTHLIFRGFQIDCREEELPEYFSNLFIVGEKGRFYRKQLFFDGAETDTNNFYTAEITTTDLDEVMDEVNATLAKTPKKMYRLNKDDLSLLQRKGYSNQEVNIFLLNWLHNIGGKWENKKHSPFVSTSYGKNGFKTAASFSRRFNNELRSPSYVLIGYVKQKDRENYIYTNEMTDTLQSLKIDWYEDIHSEIIIKDAIFPHYIIGVMEIVNNNRTLVLNPYLYNLLASDFTLKEILKILVNYSIPINQNEFYERAEWLGYVGYGYDNGENRFIGRIGEAASIQLPNNYF